MVPYLPWTAHDALSGASGWLHSGKGGGDGEVDGSGPGGPALPGPENDDDALHKPHVTGQTMRTVSVDSHAPMAANPAHVQSSGPYLSPPRSPHLCGGGSLVLDQYQPRRYGGSEQVTAGSAGCAPPPPAKTSSYSIAIA